MRVFGEKCGDMLNQKQVTFKHVTCNSFPWNKGDFEHQFNAQICTKIRSILHTQENAQATLHPNKELIFKLKNLQLLTKVKRFKIMMLIYGPRSSCLDHK